MNEKFVKFQLLCKLVSYGIVITRRAAEQRSQDWCSVVFLCERRIHYAKDKVSRSYFYNFNGVRDGLRHDLLQHFPQHRWNG